MDGSPKHPGDEEFASHVAHVLRQVSSGDQAAAGDLLPFVYDQLRALAQQRMMQERPGHTLQATALVHEVFLKLVERMIVEFNGTTNTRQWVDENDNILRGRSGTFELSRSGGVKVMNIFLGGSSTESSSFIYTLSGNQFRIVSGMLANRRSLPEVELRVYNRMVATDPK